jgi:hypothetical protein
MPVILQVSQSSATTDINGLASIVPSAGGYSAPLGVDFAVTTGSGAMLDYPLELLPATGSDSTDTSLPTIGVLPRAPSVRSGSSRKIRQASRGARSPHSGRAGDDHSHQGLRSEV